MSQRGLIISGMSMTAFIVTGASRGIGKAAATALGRGGANVLVNYNSSRSGAEETAAFIEKNGGAATVFKADVSDFSQAEAMINFAYEKFGRIDALVNNAGIALPQIPFDMTEKSDWERVFGTNVFGMMNMVKAVLPYMIHQKEGSIVNLTSVWGISGGSCEAVYSASKAAVIGFTKAMAKELAPSNIRVNAVAPGIIQTDMNRGLSDEDLREIEKEIPLGRIGKPESIGEIIAFLCGKQSGYITGEIIKADGGWI